MRVLPQFPQSHGESVQTSYTCLSAAGGSEVSPVSFGRLAACDTHTHTHTHIRTTNDLSACENVALLKATDPISSLLNKLRMPPQGSWFYCSQLLTVSFCELRVWLKEKKKNSCHSKEFWKEKSCVACTIEGPQFKALVH